MNDVELSVACQIRSKELDIAATQTRLFRLKAELEHLKQSVCKHESQFAFLESDGITVLVCPECHRRTLQE